MFRLIAEWVFTRAYHLFHLSETRNNPFAKWINNKLGKEVLAETFRMPRLIVYGGHIATAYAANALLRVIATTVFAGTPLLITALIVSALGGIIWLIINEGILDGVFRNKRVTQDNLEDAQQHLFSLTDLAIAVPVLSTFVLPWVAINAIVLFVRLPRMSGVTKSERAAAYETFNLAFPI